MLTLDIAAFSKTIFYILTLFILAYLVIGIYLYLNQERIVYHPDNRPIDNCPSLSGASLIKQGNTRMLVKNNNSKKALVYYHGNAGNACDRSQIAEIFESMGYSYILAEYEGYAGDSKKPTHEGIKQNVREVVKYLSTKEYSDIILLGESIGSGPALFHLSIKPVGKLILVNPFVSLPSLAKSIFWFYPFDFLIKNPFKNDEIIKDFKGEVLILTSQNDEVIPNSQGKGLFQISKSQKKSHLEIYGATHNSIYQSSKSIDAIKNFAK